VGPITIRRHDVYMQSKGKEFLYGRIEVDLTAQPATIDLFFDSGVTYLGRSIYKLEGKRLSICMDNAREGRPTGFTTDRSSKDRTVIVLELID
jgi:uncharacterized protein (TIGR03067 family)